MPTKFQNIGTAAEKVFCNSKKQRKLACAIEKAATAYGESVVLI